jgi:hypothetical protein
MQRFVPAALSSIIPSSLQQLRLNWISVAMDDLQHLATCAQLTSLKLICCELPTLPAAQNPLATLTSLRELCVMSSEVSIVRGLAQLTSLHLLSDAGGINDVLLFLAGMSQLQELELGFEDDLVETAHVRQIVTISNQLRSLTLAYTFLDQEGFDVLLTRATQLTSLTVWSFELTQDRSQSPCTWKDLTIREPFHPEPVLAYVPLYSLERLQVGDSDNKCLPTGRPVLEFEIGRSTRRLLLRPALANLERCPAWQHSGPCIELSLSAYNDQPFHPAEIMQVFGALAALASKSLYLSIDASKLVMDKAAVQQLSTAVGHRLTGLTLSACKLRANFWPAMWADLPGLQQLRLWGDVSSRLNPHSFMNQLKAATHPLRLELSQGWCTVQGRADQLQQRLQQSGVTQVTVVPLPT